MFVICYGYKIKSPIERSFNKKKIRKIKWTRITGCTYVSFTPLLSYQFNELRCLKHSIKMTRSPIGKVIGYSYEYYMFDNVDNKFKSLYKKFPFMMTA